MTIEKIENIHRTTIEKLESKMINRGISYRVDVDKLKTEFQSTINKVENEQKDLRKDYMNQVNVVNQQLPKQQSPSNPTKNF
ncbi:hypothetical protein [Gottfriedia acidiceleris]|uniref:hypothetical protein n=1 Tax=Gottfriedia acidiceleris TaxID=371036 RepID=UPI003D209C0A